MHVRPRILLPIAEALVLYKVIGVIRIFFFLTCCFHFLLLDANKMIVLFVFV